MRKIARFLISRRRLPVVALLFLLALSQQTAFGAEPKITVEVGKSGDAFIVNALIDLQAPLEVAWEAFVDIDHMTNFLDNLTYSKVISRTGNVLVARQEGVARYGPFSYSFVSEREVRLDPMKRIVSKSLSGTLKRMQSEAIFIPVDQGVRIKYSAEIVPDSILARMFGQSVVRHEVSEQFVSMSKEILRRAGIGASEGNSPAVSVRAAEAN